MALTAAAADATDRILLAAERCFRDLTYAGVSVRQIAERAGVSKSLVLYHFESKEHLFAELQLRVYRRLARSVTEAARTAGSPAERARVALDLLIDTVREGNDLAVHAMLGARALSNRAGAAHVRRMRRELRALLHGTIKNILGPDSERLPLSVQQIADLLWAALTGLGIQSVLEDSPAELERGFEAVRAITAMALGAGGVEARGGGER